MGHTIFWTIVVIWIVIDVYLVFFFNKENKQRNPEKKSKYIVFALTLFGIFGARFIAPSTQVAFNQSFNLIRYLSIPVILLGLIIRFWAVIQLGKSFSGDLGTGEGGQLYTGGLYKTIRHPSYLGLLIAFTGIAGVFYHPVSSSMVIIFPLIAFTYRISIEEKILKREFGEEYVEYSLQTKKIIPYIY